MIKKALKTNIALFAMLVLSACATQEKSEQVAGDVTQCRQGETLTCDEFAGETYNCSCERGDNLRDMLDAYKTPDY